MASTPRFGRRRPLQPRRPRARRPPAGRQPGPRAARCRRLRAPPARRKGQRRRTGAAVRPPGAGRRTGPDLAESVQHCLDRGSRRAVADDQQLPRRGAQLAESVGEETVGFALGVVAHHRHGEQPWLLRVQAEAPGERARGGAVARRAPRDTAPDRRTAAAGAARPGRRPAAPSIRRRPRSARAPCRRRGSPVRWRRGRRPRHPPAALARTTPRPAGRAGRAQP